MVGTDQNREILCHVAIFNGLDADPFQRFGKTRHIGRIIELAAIDQAAGPGEDRGDRVGRGRLALLMLAIMTGDGAVRGFRLDAIAGRRHQHRGHQAE